MFTIEATRNYGVPRLIHYCISGAARGGGVVERASYRSHDNSGGGGRCEGERTHNLTSTAEQQHYNTAERAAGYNTRHTLTTLLQGRRQLRTTGDGRCY